MVRVNAPKGLKLWEYPKMFCLQNKSDQVHGKKYFVLPIKWDKFYIKTFCKLKNIKCKIVLDNNFICGNIDFI